MYAKGNDWEVNCQDQKIREMLVEYVLGQSTGTDVVQVEAHIGSCDSCQSDVSFLRSVRQDLQALKQRELLQHPSVENLVYYVENSDGLDASTATGIKRHLLFCRQCQAEVAAIDQNESAHQVAVSGRPHISGSPLSPKQGRVGSIFWHPIFGYAVAAGLALFIIFEGSIKSTSDSGIQIVPVQRIEQQLRSTTSRSTVFRFSGEDQLGLQFRPPSGRLADVVVTLQDKDDKVLSRQSFKDGFDDSLLAQIIVNSKGLEDGQYRLLIEAVNRDTGERVKAAYDFELSTRR